MRVGAIAVGAGTLNCRPANALFGKWNFPRKATAAVVIHRGQKNMHLSVSCLLLFLF